ncbi:eukaryotic translation initiation factor 4E-binding protein Mextli isoform X3 [Drosophila santomea]|uniref:eukaryotic translation initiation factor 4E-binding protein Mextli isoform X3 n=1 Tax=Drosophila santomea TaxID=129105 RepID=UPI001CCB58E8|nr:eukaryotic translation initiation factor 4E-binding protein Mextli isoform X3 [Drosophila santomea]
MAHTHLGRAVKNIEAPRPLKTQSRSSLKNSYLVIEELIQLIDSVTVGLQSCNTTPDSITLLLHNLRVHGPQLEAVSKDTLDRAFVVFRNASQDERLNITTRLKLLELIELRAKSWDNDDTIAYYKSKQQISNVELPSEYQYDAGVQPGAFSTSPTFGVSGGVGGVNVGAAAAAAAVFNAASAAAAAQAAAIAAVGSPNQQHMLLPPGEVIRNSGKFPKPTKIPGKTYCKDEVVIRNADSGKVNPGAKERLVQITGPAEDKINYAKQLMEDTIRRNASPVRLEPAPGAGGSCSSLNSSNSDDAIVQPRTPTGSSLANRLSFNSAQNFMTATAAAQQISQQMLHQTHHQQHQQQQQQVAAVAAAAAAAAHAQATAAAGKVLRPNQQLLMHSYSTNDASVGEYKFTVNVGQHLIKITGDCCELVRVAKLVLDDYFSSSEFLASIEAGAAFDGTSLVSPVTTPSTPLPGAGPPQFLLPGTDSGIGLNYAASSATNNNGEGDDEVFAEPSNGGSSTNNQNGLARSRRSHFSRKESTPETKGAREKFDVDELAGQNPLKSNASRVSYDIEHLIYYSMSPHAWALPTDWQKMQETTPSILRNKVISPFDGLADRIAYSTNTPDSTIASAPNSSVITHSPAINSITSTPNTNIISTAVGGAAVEASADHPITVTNKQSKGIIADRETRRLPKTSAVSDRNLYNKQLQIITNTVGKSGAPHVKNRQSNYQSSQVKAIFQRYCEDDEFSMALCETESNNNRVYF